MRPRKQKKADHDDRFRTRLDQIINLYHALVLLTDKRVAKQATLMVFRYAHFRRFRCRNKKLNFLRRRLAWPVREIAHKTKDDDGLRAVFAIPLSKANQFRLQRQRQRGRKLCSWHAPESECIGKGRRPVGEADEKASRPFRGAHCRRKPQSSWSFH